jgi:CBS domain-containing protein
MSDDFDQAASEFEEAWDAEPARREAEEEQRLGEAILHASIRDLEPKPAVSVAPGVTIRKAIELMLERNIGSVLVVEPGGRVAGIFTERDVMRRVAGRGIDLGRSVEDVMTPDPECLRLDDRIGYALNRMIAGGYRRIPVLDADGQARAVLSVREVVAYIVSLLPARILNLPPTPELEARSPDGG